MELKAILTKYNFPASASSSMKLINDIEDVAKFGLPEDYKYYLNNFKEHECFIGGQCLRLWDLNNVVKNNISYNIFNNLHQIIVIGTNMSGECIALKCINPDNYRIMLFDFIDMSEEYHIEIGTSFTNMLVRLEEGKEWFR